MDWISFKDKQPPKERAFLFAYPCGVGLGSWGQTYTTIHGNSERTHYTYFLVLQPKDISERGEPMQWDNDKMLEMDVHWMPLPEPPKEQ